MKKTIKANTVLLLVIVGLGACQNTSKDVVADKDSHEHFDVIELTDSQVNLAKISTSILEKTELSTVIKVTGKIDVPPQNMVAVSAPMSGFLKHTKLLPGLHLKKGEVIAVMEDQSYIQLQEDYLSNEAEMIYSKGEFERQEQLLNGNAGSNKLFEDAKSKYENNLIKRKALSEKLKMLGIQSNQLSASNLSSTIKIVSPIDGYVSKVNVNVGKYIQATESMFELVNPEDIHLNLTIFESDVHSLYIGQKVYAYNNSQPNIIYPCEIILIGQDVSADRHVEVHCHFEKYDKSLIPGMYMNGEIQSNLKSVYALPEKAIVNFEGKNYVFVETEQLHFVMKEVQLGLREFEKVEIINFSDFDGKKIVFEGAYTLLMKSKNSETEGHAH
jgi:cobalt-zinc-cadmium efflux system membrane fusion protein